MPPQKKTAVESKAAADDLEGVMPPPLPMPPQKKATEVGTHHLVEIPCVYLYDRNGWADFKRALNECGLVWNFSDWMTTIVFHGFEYEAICAAGNNLDEYFPVVEKKSAGDGADSKSSSLGTKLVALLGLPKNMGDYIKPGVQYCCLNAVEFECERKLPARQKMWNWIVKSLRGTRPTPGAYHYLVDEVQTYDISRLRRAIKRLHDMNERIPPAGRIVLPDSCSRRVDYQAHRGVVCAHV